MKAGESGAVNRLWNWLGGLFVFAMPLLSTWLLWASPEKRRLFLGGDFVEHIGARSQAYRLLANGQLPLWDHLRETGLPFPGYLSDLFNPVLLVFPLLLEDGFLRNDAMQLVMVLHLAAGGLGAYLWGLGLCLGRTAACVMGLIWGLNGFILVKATGQDLLIHTLAWVPYVFLFLDRARRKSSFLASAWAGFFLALLFTGGHPQFFFYFALALAVHLVYWAGVLTEKDGPKKALPILIRMYLPLVMFALLVSGPQAGHFLGRALGGLQMLSPSDGWGDLIFSQQASAHVRGVFYFLLPRLAEGGTESLVYVGIIPLAFGIMALYYLRGRELGYWKLLLAMGLVLMMGGSMGLHKVLVDLLPGYGLFRETRRWVVLCHLALAVLSGYFIAWLLVRKPPPKLTGATRALGVLAGILLAGMLMSLMLQRSGLVKHGFALEPLMNGLTAAVVLCASAWLILKRISAGHRGRALRLFLVAVVAVDLGFFHLPMTLYNFKDIPSDPSKVTAEMTEDADKLAELSEGEPWRFAIPSGALHQSARYRAGVMRTGTMPPHVERLLPLGYWQIHWQPNKSPRYPDLLSIRYFAEDSPRLKAARASWQVAGYSQAGCRLDKDQPLRSLAVRAGADFIDHARRGQVLAWLALVKDGKLVASWPLRWDQEIKHGLVTIPLEGTQTADELIMASVHPEALVDFEKIMLNGESVTDRMAVRKARYGVVENLNALPLCRFVSRASVVEPEHEYLAALQSVDPSRCVIFRKMPPGFNPPAGPTPGPEGSAVITLFSPEKVEVSVKADKSGYLLMSQTAAHGWRAEVDGSPAPVLKAYGFLVSVEVPAGEHEVVLTYAEPLLTAGLAASPLAMMALILWSLAAWAGGRRKK